MIENTLPSWLPFINIGISLVGLLISIYLLFWGDDDKRLKYGVYVIVNLILLAGALFQANLVGLFLWTLIGTGGRILNVLFLSADAGKDIRQK